MQADTIIMSSVMAWTLRSSSPDNVVFYQSTSLWNTNFTFATIFPCKEAAEEMAEEWRSKPEYENRKFDVVSFYQLATQGKTSRLHS